MFFVCPYAYQEPKGRRLPYVPMCVCVRHVCDYRLGFNAHFDVKHG